MLGILPTEVIQLVLRTCDTPTFLQAAFSCRALLEIASSSRDVLLHQLSQTPGWNDGISERSTRELFQLILERAHAELFGAEFYIKPKIFDLEGKRIDTRASSLHATSSHHLQALLAYHGHEFVDLCGVQDGNLNLRKRMPLPGKQYGETEILQTSLSPNGAWVLHRFKPFVDKDLDTKHPWVKQALSCNAQGSFFLAWYDVNNWDQVPCIRLYGFVEQNGYEPLAFAADGSKFAISWQHLQRPNDHQVVLYSTDGRHNPQDAVSGWVSGYEAAAGVFSGAKRVPVIESVCQPCIINEASIYGCTNGMDLEKGPVRRLAFNDRGHQLLYHHGSQTLYGSFQSIQILPSPSEPRATMRANADIVRFQESLSLSFSIGIPFFGTHESTDPFLRNVCHWQYLSIGIATHRVQHWTVACLLKSESRPSSIRCGGAGHPWNLERGRRLEHWHVMAQLGGFQEATTSHGSVIATSRRGTRVAVASWKTISIWALEPDMLIEEEFSYYPESWQSSDSYPVLRPAIIQLEGVCSQLMFTKKEDELVAITDRGLVYFHLWPSHAGMVTGGSDSDTTEEL
ncbi:hypothetical protein N7492_003965 [Penicillium capsulatum]|uniref:F-box domain-containing protein n=1 Tax=Penicillium capsulatum TaxID=69766 RepID=A0A9W9ILJ5_9EURO|nr:hypothetical protein N7492_003965 [Penicillium capsulatum]KAJ6121457.1 hypothetical protein N7512_003922 [Penicillium capsulatum]